MLPLVDVAKPVITLLCQLQSHAINHYKLPEQQQVGKKLDALVIELRKNHITESKIKMADYLLSTALDEAYYYACATPMTYHLLAERHQDSKGGERFFDYLANFLDYPEQNRDLLQLCFICLSVGFKGKFALIKQGTEILLNKRRQLLTAINASTTVSKPKNVSMIKKSPRIYRHLSIGSLLIVVALYFVVDLSLSHQLSKIDNLYQQSQLLQQQITISGDNL